MRRRLTFVKSLVWCACLAPLAWLVLRGFGVDSLTLGADPVQEVLNVCGKTALNLLILTLCITPIRRSTGWNRLISFRRLLGLFAFFYLILHFLTYAFLDLQDWSMVLEDIAKRPYITLGFTALMLLIPLAITSTSGWQRRLGRKWTKLHRLIYPVAVLAVIHFYWQSKRDVSEPLLYFFVLSMLFSARLMHWWDLRSRRRRQSVDAKTTMAPTYQRVEPP